MIAGLIAALGLPEDYAEVVDRHWQPLAERIAAQAQARDAPLLVAINGAQGSGKTTLCRFLELLLAERRLRSATLALDDLYLPNAARANLAVRVHPLFATRGVPGTHDVALGLGLIEAMRAGRAVEMPIFDKASDDRLPQTRKVAGGVQVILFEGWCLGAKPQSETALADPVNALEAGEDPHGIWRGAVNCQLAGPYAPLFAAHDLLVMLKPSSFEQVLANRLRQEARLAAQNPGGSKVMDEAGVFRFVAHYERLTRHMFAEMPGRADVLYELDERQRPC